MHEGAAPTVIRLVVATPGQGVRGNPWTIRNNFGQLVRVFDSSQQFWTICNKIVTNSSKFDGGHFLLLSSHFQLITGRIWIVANLSY